MTNTVQQQMRVVIEEGIRGWFESCFKDDKQPVDSLTDYPLTRKTARVVYRTAYPYLVIQDCFLRNYPNIQYLDTRTLQKWVNYHWKYASLELAEDFGDTQLVPLTADMQSNREDIRNSMKAQGYRLIDKL